MSHTAPAQPPAVVLRSTYLHLRALLAVAIVAIVGLTVAVVLLAASTGGGSTIASSAARANPSAILANPSATTGAKLDHRVLSPTTPLNHPPGPQPASTTDYGGHY
jgi:hypothetical protein